MRYLYLLILFFSIIMPLAFSFHRKLNFHHQFKAAFLSIVTVALPFVLWDMYFAASSIWGFNSRYLLGISIYNLPLEEVLFFICIPFCCLFTYHSLNLMRKSAGHIQPTAFISIILGTVLFLTGLFYLQRSYTLWSFVAAGLSLIILGIKRPHYINNFWIAYIILLLPFFIVNGILTGRGSASPVVWYNNAENLRLRLLTIPVEDFVYGMTLILWNIVLFETFSKKISREHKT
jgi:lycopene cyclase domain-containing protein